MNRFLLSLTLMASTAPAYADIVVSDEPDSVSITIYRDPGRSEGGAINLDMLRGFALVSETRRIRLSRGETDIRFEGVADGIIPVSAIVTGLPGGTIQRNRDANLLSPASLIDGSLGNRVTIRRADTVTGEMREQDAIVRAGPGDGVIFETEEGIEALRCSGLPETILFDERPQGVSAHPVFMVRTYNAEAVTVTVTLSYLANGFDWTAHYVADLSEDQATIDILAWLTLANSNAQSFRDAEVFAVGGTLNRVAARDIAGEAQNLELRLNCWPQDSTHTYPDLYFGQLALGGLAPGVSDGVMAPIVVTAARRVSANLEQASPISVIAVQEDLGDLKLYRFPERVTVAANAQKQVALLVQPEVRFERLYVGATSMSNLHPVQQALELTYRTENVSENGLGVAMPSGTVTIFEQAAGRRLPISEQFLADTTIDGEVELSIAPSRQVVLTSANSEDKFQRSAMVYTVSNANDRPATIELDFGTDDSAYRFNDSSFIIDREGRNIWAIDVPANGERSITVSAQ